jgi:predicted dehydrogenase
VNRNFLDAVRSRAPLVVTPDDDVELMRILDRSYESAATAQSVSLAPLAMAAAG